VGDVHVSAPTVLVQLSVGRCVPPALEVADVIMCALTGKTLRIQMQLGYMDVDVVVCSK
jgi:hypothetical protein